MSIHTFDKLCRGSMGNQMPMLHKRHIIGNGFYIVYNMGCPKNAPVSGEVMNVLSYPCALLWVKTRRRLVQYYDLWVA